MFFSNELEDSTHESLNNVQSSANSPSMMVNQGSLVYTPTTSAKSESQFQKLDPKLDKLLMDLDFID